MAVDGVYHLLPQGRTSPFLRLGLGILTPDLADLGTEFGEELFPFAILGGGVEYLVSDQTGIRLGVSNHYPFMDGLDGIEEGDGNDSIWNFSLGFTWYR